MAGTVNTRDKILKSQVLHVVHVAIETPDHLQATCTSCEDQPETGMRSPRQTYLFIPPEARTTDGYLRARLTLELAFDGQPVGKVEPEVIGAKRALKRVNRRQLRDAGVRARRGIGQERWYGDTEGDRIAVLGVVDHENCDGLVVRSGLDVAAIGSGHLPAI